MTSRNSYEEQTGRDVGGPFSEFDTLGRKQPRRLGISDYLLLIARSEPGRVRRVPVKAIDSEGIDEIGEFALLICPCGALPVARPGLEKCTGCERYYVVIERGAVFVTYGAMPAPVFP